jgi:hypothetical protein
MKLTGESRITRGKTCPSATLFTTNSTWTDPGSNPGLCGEMPATNRLSHGTAPRTYLQNHIRKLKLRYKFQISIENDKRDQQHALRDVTWHEMTWRDMTWRDVTSQTTQKHQRVVTNILTTNSQLVLFKYRTLLFVLCDRQHFCRASSEVLNMVTWRLVTPVVCPEDASSTFRRNVSKFHVTPMVKVKIKVSLEQATKAQRGSRGIALLFL